MQARTVRVRDAFVLARFGAASHDRYRAACSDALRETFVVPGERWVDFAQLVEATQLACELFARGDVGLARDVGRYAAEVNLGIFKWLAYRLLSPVMVLEVANGVWKQQHDSGQIVVSREGDFGVRLRIENFASPHRMLCLSLEGWLWRTIELGGPKYVRIVEVGCRLWGHSACEFVGEWR